MQLLEEGCPCWAEQLVGLAEQLVGVAENLVGVAEQLVDLALQRVGVAEQLVGVAAFFAEEPFEFGLLSEEGVHGCAPNQSLLQLHSEMVRTG